MSHDEGATCGCVAEHRPAPLELHVHHVVPTYLGGRDEQGNLVWLCPTTHVNVHELLRLMMSAGLLSYGECQQAQVRPVSRYAHTLAVRGYTAWRTSQVAVP